MASDFRERVRIAVEPLDAAAFAPFGEQLGARDDDRALERNTYAATARVYRTTPPHTPKGIEFLAFRSRFRPLEVKFLERHVELSQAFIPLGGQPYVCAVARPDAELVDGIPAPGEIRSFLVPGDCALQLHPGTWHEPPFPLADGQTMLITSHDELTRGLESERDAWGEFDDLDVEKRSYGKRGIEIKLDLG